MKSIHVHEIFILMGLIIVISFLGSTFFRKTRIPNSILLIMIGMALNLWKNPIDLNVLQSLAPIFGSFALLLILLEAGLEFDMRNFLKSIGPSVVFGTLSYVLGVSAILFILKNYFQYSFLNSLMLGMVSVGCSPSILMPILKAIPMDKNHKAFLDLECNVTEVLGLILTISFMPFLLPSLNGASVNLHDIFVASSHKFLIIFVIALFVPVIVGMIWSRLLSFAGERPLWPILSIGVTLLLYGATESLGGKGALNVLIFGLVVGNARIIRLFFVKLFTRMGFTGKISAFFLSFFVGQHFAKVQHISREFSFFVRTFFFVYLGIIVDFSKFNMAVFFVACVLTLAPMFVRYFLGHFFQKINLFPVPAVNYLVFLTPRGLANALIVFAVIDYAQQMNFIPTVFVSLRETLITPVFGVIILSNLLLTFYFIFRKEGKVVAQTNWRI